MLANDDTDFAAAPNKDELTDTCINNLNQNLNNIKRSIAHQQAQQVMSQNDADMQSEEYENFSHLTSKISPVHMTVDPRLQKQLNLLNSMNNQGNYETTQHELFINPIANDITQFALDSCKLEQKIAAKFKRAPQQLNLGKHI